MAGLRKTSDQALLDFHPTASLIRIHEKQASSDRQSKETSLSSLYRISCHRSKWQACPFFALCAGDPVAYQRSSCLTTTPSPLKPFAAMTPFLKASEAPAASKAPPTPSRGRKRPAPFPAEQALVLRDPAAIQLRNGGRLAGALGGNLIGLDQLIKS
jgi:hypothetical protein